MFKNKNDFNSLKIADFGFSTVCENYNETLDCGTLIYKSPEQVSKSFYDVFVDTWAAGYIMYILCSGGQHPIYKVGMSYNEYVDNVKKLKEWSFPSCFPL